MWVVKSVKRNVGKSNLRGKLTGVAAVEVALKKSVGIWEHRQKERQISKDRGRSKGIFCANRHSNAEANSEATCTKLFLYGPF